MENRSFIGDVLEQPKCLRAAILNYPLKNTEELFSCVKSGKIKRIVLAGHGSSYNAMYPAYLNLCRLPIPVSLWKTAELLHYGLDQINHETLLCLNSQSGTSVEVERLTDTLQDKSPAFICGFTNYPDSPLGRRSNLIIPLYAGQEHGVAIKTYLNSLALLILFSTQFIGGGFENAKNDLINFCDELEIFLSDWQRRIDDYSQLLGEFDRALIIGRGPSMASALNGAINQKEASLCFTEGLNAAEFRHGPLELADEQLTLIVVEGDKKTRKFNETLAKEVQGYGSHVVWIGKHTIQGIDSIKTPNASEKTQPVADIIPLQLIAQAIANKKGIEAGEFRRIGKIVLKE